jgi:hypothetical protein
MRSSDQKRRHTERRKESTCHAVRNLQQKAPPNNPLHTLQLRYNEAFGKCYSGIYIMSCITIPLNCCAFQYYLWDRVAWVVNMGSLWMARRIIMYSIRFQAVPEITDTRIKKVHSISSASFASSHAGGR